MNKVIVIALLAVVILVLALYSASTRTSSDSRTYSLAQTPAQIIEHRDVETVRVPAFYRNVPTRDRLTPTMAPEIFTGNARLAYQAAREIPLTLAQLPCYCHCDRTKGHKSLHSCFESEHAENCGICIGEALMAYGLEKQAGLRPEEIRQRIIAAYGSAENQ
jgi:Protein of unknown function with PCYCGC motif